MKCQKNNCPNEAEYHIKKADHNLIICYDHTVDILGYNPNASTPCECCNLLTIITHDRHIQKKSIREINARHKFDGEKSPYWEFLRNQNCVEADGPIKEDVLANPDVLSEDDHLYHRPLSKEGEDRFQLIREMLAEFSPQQRKVLQLCGFDGLTQEQTAKELGISQPAVSQMLRTVQKRIKARYDELKKDGD